jgi:hypothetical protein
MWNNPIRDIPQWTMPQNITPRNALRHKVCSGEDKIKLFSKIFFIVVFINFRITVRAISTE